LHEEHPGAAARLTSLYATYATDAFRFALHLTGRREDAEDVVQFVFLRAYGMLESGTDLVNPRAWLMKATKHRSLNMIRDRREAPMADTELPVGPRYDPDPAEAEALAEVRSTLWALPETQHHAFVLRHWSGLSQDEIAEVLGTTPGAVESLLVRARTALVDDREQHADCSGVRRRLVQALAPTGGQQAHIDACRRCRTAQTRLLRAAEFATAFTLVPRPHVAHALASMVPGFSAPAIAATTTATGAAGAGAGVGAGGGAGIATASAATKVALAAKVALATTTAVVALSAAHPVRRAVEHVVLGSPAKSAARAPHRPTATTADGSGGASPAPGSPANGKPAHGSSPAHPTHPAHPAHGGNGKGKAHGKGGGKGLGKGGSPPGGKGKAKGKPATPGSSGATHGKSATAGANGKATGKPATAGSQGKAKGKAKKATTTTATTAGGGSAPAGHGKGKSKS
jgi:RNA polymerase sigma factor (sigma-70 family)